MILYRFHFFYELIFYNCTEIPRNGGMDTKDDDVGSDMSICMMLYLNYLVRINYMHVIVFKAQELCGIIWHQSPLSSMKLSLFYPPTIVFRVKSGKNGLFWESTGPSQSTKLDGSNEVPNEQRSLVHFSSQVHGICLFFLSNL